VCDLEAALDQQLGHVAEAEPIAQPPEHGEQHNVRRVLEVVKWRTGPSVKAMAA
jgi:hypothetical protein